MVSYNDFGNEIIKNYQDINELKVSFLIDNIGDIHINKMESIINKDKSIEIKLNKDYIRIVKRGLYLSQNTQNKIIAGMTYTENSIFQKDQDFLNFSSKKNDLESILYKVKNLIQNKNLDNNEYNGKNIMTCLQEIEEQIYDCHDKIIDLKPIEDYLDNILLSITPSEVTTEKEKIINEINNCEKILNEKKNKNQKDINDATNMLDYFKKQLHLVIDLKELENLNKEFNSEKGKYF